MRESACLNVEDRRRLDVEMCAEQNALEGKGNKRIEADAKTIAYRLDPHAVVERAVQAPNERNVWVRPAPDAMAYVTALLAEQQIPEIRGLSLRIPWFSLLDSIAGTMPLIDLTRKRSRQRW